MTPFVLALYSLVVVALSLAVEYSVTRRSLQRQQRQLTRLAALVDMLVDDVEQINDDLAELGTAVDLLTPPLAAEEHDAQPPAAEDELRYPTPPRKLVLKRRSWEAAEPARSHAVSPEPIYVPALLVPTYDVPAPVYDAGDVYRQPPADYSSPQPDYGSPAPDYSSPQPDYGGGSYTDSSSAAQPDLASLG